MYEKNGRKRDFHPKWKQEFIWLKYEKVGMTCTVCCMEGEQTGAFVVGCKNFKKDTIQAHERSEVHYMCVKERNAKLDPTNTPAAKTIRALNQITLSQLKLKFR